MDCNMFEDIVDFHRKFSLPVPKVPCYPEEEIMSFRIKFMQEELQEFVDAFGEGDLTKGFDALIDLVYVVLGTARMMNLPWNDGWREVHQANMRKVKALSAAQSKRGSKFDVVKPEGWVNPEIMLSSLLLKHEYESLVIESRRRKPQRVGARYEEDGEEEE